MKAREYRMSRSGAVMTAGFAVIMTGWGVLEIVAGAMGWSEPSGVAYVAGAGLIAFGWFCVQSLRRVTWADDAGLRLRGMFRTRVVPWSDVRYILAGPDARVRIIKAVLVDGMVKLPGTDVNFDRQRQFAADLTAVMPSQPWLAIGLDLTAAPAAEGSRHTPLLVTEQLRYRANWGLPGMTGTDQTGAPLLCASASTLAPGDRARAVIIPLTGQPLSQWHRLSAGDRLRLFEGSRVRGHAVVLWSESTSLPVPSSDTDRFSLWTSSRDDLPGP